MLAARRASGGRVGTYGGEEGAHRALAEGRETKLHLAARVAHKAAKAVTL